MRTWLTIFLTAAACVSLSENPIDKVKQLEAATKRSDMASNWRALSDAYVEAKMFPQASNAFMRASELYEKSGDPNAAKWLEIQSQRYETKVGVYVQRPLDPDSLSKRYYSGARLEPIYGCYLGAFIDREDKITTTFTDNSQTYREPEEFALATGRKHAIYFMYLRYGRPFPTVWTDRLREVGAAAHIVWEPDTLDDVQDNDYLREFAESAKNCGVPIFLRYAGEMNGDWVPYGKDPQQYREKFRLVSQRMHEIAPNVAMVWCPNEIPENTIDSYFPGDDAVDWVGLNFYSVLYNDADRARGAEWMNPADKLRYVYDKYSKKHPIIIGEWAATHLSTVDNVLRPDFAQTKIAQLYTALPRIYPRVKAVDWLSMNTIAHASPGRRLNNYSLLEVPRVASAYGRAISSPYYLSEVSSFPQCAPWETALLTPGSKVSGIVHLSANVKTYDQRPNVKWLVNDQAEYETDIPGSYAFDLDTTKYPPGPATIRLVVTDQAGNKAGEFTTKVEINNVGEKAEGQEKAILASGPIEP